MVNIMERWKKIMEPSEKLQQGGKASKRAGDSSKKTSAERAVERLAERKGNSNPTATQSQLYAARSEDVLAQENSLASAEKEEEVFEEQAATAEVEEVPVLSLEEIKKIVETALHEVRDVEEIKEYLDQKFAVVDKQIKLVRNTQKDEMIVRSVQDITEKVDWISLNMRKLGSIKVMVGVSIWCSLLTLAVLVAHVLNFLS